MYMNFTQKLMEAKRRARLMGRPLAKSEVAGITAGYAATASERLARTKQLKLQKEGLTLQEKMHTESLAQRKYETEQELQVGREAMRRERREGRVTGALGGAAAGAYVGSVVPGLGTLAGAIIGGVVGLFGGSCIIISACTDPYSYEVNIAREYRDNYLSLQELVGYYALAEIVVPIMPKKLVKRYLVDRLVDYGEVALGYKPKLRYRSSRYVKRGFLGLCSFIGRLLVGRMEVEA